MNKKTAVYIVLGTLATGALVCFGNWYHREITFRN